MKACERVFLLCFLGQIVTWQYDSNLLDYNWPCTVINDHDWQLWNSPLWLLWFQSSYIFNGLCLNTTLMSNYTVCVNISWVCSNKDCFLELVRAFVKHSRSSWLSVLLICSKRYHTTTVKAQMLHLDYYKYDVTYPITPVNGSLSTCTCAIDISRITTGF